MDINKHVIDSYSLSTVFGKMRCYESGISEKLDSGCICSQMYKQQVLIKSYAEGTSYQEVRDSMKRPFCRATHAIDMMWK